MVLYLYIESNVKIIKRIDCFDKLLELFRIKSSNYLIKLCDICSTLILSEKNKIIFEENHGLNSIRKCLVSKDIQLLISSSTLLYNSSFNGINKYMIDNIKKKLFSPKIFPILLSLITNENEKIKLNVMKTIRNMSFEFKRKDVIIKYNITEKLIKMIPNSDKDIVICICKTLWNLTASANYNNEIKENDGIKILIEYLKSEDNILKTYIFGILYNLTLYSILENII